MSSPPGPATPSPLNYAPRPPAHQRRVFRRISVATVLLAFVVSGWWWVPPVSRRVRLIYWQNKCMVHAAPRDQLVYDPNFGTVIPPPAEWIKFYEIYSPPGFRSDGTVFLHELRRPDGQRRLVAVDLLSSEFIPTLCTSPRVFVPGDMFRPPVQLAGPVWGPEISFPLVVKVLAGSLDPADPTHFTFRTQHGTVETVYDGWLGNDDRINIGERRSSPSPN